MIFFKHLPHFRLILGLIHADSHDLEIPVGEPVRERDDSGKFFDVRRRGILHLVLRSLAAVLAILLAVILIDRAVRHAFNRQRLLTFDSCCLPDCVVRRFRTSMICLDITAKARSES